jgi:hypothetical protein
LYAKDAKYAKMQMTVDTDVPNENALLASRLGNAVCGK